VKGTLAVIRGDAETEVKVGAFQENQHPRDRRGRFIEVGGTVSLFGGGQAEVLEAVGGGRIRIRKQDGSERVIDAGLTTQIRTAAETRANPLRADGTFNPDRPTEQADHGEPPTSGPSVPPVTVPGGHPVDNATPDGSVSYLRADGGTSDAWLHREGDQGQMVGYLRPDVASPDQVHRFDNTEAWAYEVDKRDMTVTDAPSPDHVGANGPDHGKVPDISAVRSVAGYGPQTASADRIQHFLHDGLGDVLPNFREAGGDALTQQSALGSNTLDEANRQAIQAKREVAAEITDRMRDVPDEHMLRQEDLNRINRLEAGSAVLLRKPRTLFDGTVKQRISDPEHPSVRDQLFEWDYSEVPRDNYDRALASGHKMPDGVEIVTADQWRDWKREERVATSVDLWAMQSNGVNPHALAMQDTAAELFGLQDVADWAAYSDYPELRDQVRESMDTNRGFNEAFLLAQYEATQQRFRDAGITEVTVHRGHKVYNDTPEWAAGAAEGPHVTNEIQLRPLSSFSTDPQVAGSFSRGTSTDEAYIISGTVPVDRILSTPRSGMGSLSEAEMVVLAGPGDWNVRHADDTDGPRVNDEFDPFGNDMEFDNNLLDGDATPFDPTQEPAGLLASREEMITAIGAADSDARRQALMNRAAALNLGELIPGTWQPDGSVRDPERQGSEPRPPLTDAEYADHVAAMQEALDRAIQDGLETHVQHTLDDANSIYTPERAALHAAILRDVYASASNVPNEGKVLFTGGLGGAGKTSSLKKVGIDQGNYLTINSDDIKEIMAERGMIPEAPGDVELSPLERVALIHEESSHIADQLALMAYADRKNVVWDLTMGSQGSVGKRLDQLSAAGYGEKRAVFVDVPVELSVTRALSRHRGGLERYRNGQGTGGRYVPVGIIRKQSDPEWGSKNRANMEALRDRFSDWVIYNNDVPKGSDPIRLYGKFDPDLSAKTAQARASAVPLEGP
jgi:hypothetical protein